MLIMGVVLTFLPPQNVGSPQAGTAASSGVCREVGAMVTSARITRTVLCNSEKWSPRLCLAMLFRDWLSKFRTENEPRRDIIRSVAGQIQDTCKRWRQSLDLRCRFSSQVSEEQEREIEGWRHDAEYVLDGNSSTSALSLKPIRALSQMYRQHIQVILLQVAIKGD